MASHKDTVGQECQTCGSPEPEQQDGSAEGKFPLPGR